MDDPSQNERSDMIYIDSEFKVTPGGKNGNVDKEILICNKSRKLRVRAPDLFEAAVWLNRLRKVSASSPLGTLWWYL